MFENLAQVIDQRFKLRPFILSFLQLSALGPEPMALTCGNNSPIHRLDWNSAPTRARSRALLLTSKSGPGRCGNTEPRPRHKCTGGTSTVNTSSMTPDPDAIRTASVTIRIVCPTWCEVSPDEHAAHLWENDGRCVHQCFVSVGDAVGKRVWEQPPRFCGPIALTLRMTTNPAGREVESADVLINAHESNVEQLLLLSAAITDLTRLYSRTPKHAASRLHQ